MKKSTNYEPSALTPFLISAAIHILFILLVLILSYRNYTTSRITREQAEREIQIETIVTPENINPLQSESASDARISNTGTGKDTGPHGLNDEAGRELVENARSGITITPDNFQEYAKLRNLRRGLNPRREKTLLDKYPFLTGRGSFDFGSGHKLKSDFQGCYEDVCAIVNLKENALQSPKEKSDNFTAAVMGYLDGTRPVRSWRTLWLARKPAVLKDKIELVRLVRRLHVYSLGLEDSGNEHMRLSLAFIVTLIPDELKFPAAGGK